MEWYSTKQLWPGDHFKPKQGYMTQEFVVVYHHGDNEIMTNLAFWDGDKFIIGTTCYCYDCHCDCNYPIEYSDGCQVTHWALVELPEFGMEIYFDEDE